MWAKVDDGFFDHPKARAAGKDGRALFFSGLCWAAGRRNGGFVAAADLPLVAAKAEVRGPVTARRLVESGLWETVSDGWWIHDFGHWNLSAERMAEVREKRAEAGRRGGRRSRPPPKQTGSKLLSKTEANGEANVEANEKQNRTPSPFSGSTSKNLHPLPTNRSKTEAKPKQLSPDKLREITRPAHEKLRADGGISDLEEPAK